jgi:hypothetical protein
MDKTVQRRFRSLNSQSRASELSKPYTAQQGLSFFLASVLALVLLFAAYPQSVVAQEEPGPLQAPSGPPYQEQTPEQLQQLVAPIALYPDSLVAQILTASTFPEQVVEADQWVQAHPDLKDDALGQAVDQQPWDPSVKALSAFPSVLGNMDKNLSWTSSLGDAYYNQQQDVMDAVQVMRQRAQEAGNLKTTDQQTVTTQDSTIIIEPASPEIVYVPAYDPWVVYGGPIVAWPGWYPYPGIWYGGPYLSFGVGYGIGYFGGYGWGWHHWGSDWHNRVVIHDHESTTLGATRFITATTTIEAETCAAESAATAADSTAIGVEIVPAAMKGTGPPVRRPAVPVGLKTVPPQGPGLLKETTTRLEDTLNLAVRAASARVPSATTTMAGRKGVFRHAEMPASAAEEGRVEAVAGIDSRSFLRFLVLREI